MYEKYFETIRWEVLRMMLLFAAVDTAAATWTWLALRSVYPK
jgi:hypothetical protein